MTPKRRLLATALTGLLLGAAAAAPAQADPSPPDHTHLNSVGSRYVGEAIPIVGWLVGAGEQHDKTLYLQRKVDGKWRANGMLTDRASGRFKFPAKHIRKPQIVRWRVVVKSHGHRLHISETLKVEVKTVPLRHL